MQNRRRSARSYKTTVRCSEHFKPNELSGPASELVGLIWSTGIAFNYNLQMTETNNNDSSL